ncbi:L-lactate transport [Desulfosporosinus acidiphilus SJ4]|uniref:L-lactate permease n=1 Tax=Desulfosporosinus acidiphilus (strain DSM 22704 / JCM 16185 / SJ4) TaxID=646529 RepID=I4D1X7_DESAJ|nr:L-lactate permease [Desulfosporosinus acidiphilus]AFM39801.1 L-lactate transport [Desulfosporosinus acidiphilus SJ4]
MKYLQNYNPAGSFWLSVFCAALPILTLLYFLALHPHKSKDGKKLLGIYAPYAAAIAAFVAFLICVFIMKMPATSAAAAFGLGVMSGLFPIGWIVFGAIFLYTMTVITGKFEIVKDSIAGITADRRLQALLVAFSFGAFIEGASGFGTPVAVAGAIMVGLGFRPLTAAVICLIANTAPVAWGAIGTPVLTLAGLTKIPDALITQMAGRQLPFFSIIIPFWCVATLVLMEKGKWKDVWEVWPAIFVTGASFAATQFLMAEAGMTMLVDIGAGIVSIIVTSLFLKVWKPKNIITNEMAYARLDGTKVVKSKIIPKYTWPVLIQAWMPWVLLAIFVALWGVPSVKTFLNSLFNPSFKVPYLHGLVFRTAPVSPTDVAKVGEAATYSFNFITMAGTGILIAALLSGTIFLRVTLAQWKKILVTTITRLKIPLTVISLVLGLSYMTRYAGTDAILALAFAKTGAMYPFFAVMIGWLGVFLTGSDTASNSLFGGLQQITAQQLGLNPLLMVTANSTGGVMGKMIDAQSITVATVACYSSPVEAVNAIGVIFRKVFLHSIALAILMGILVWLQAYVFTWMIPGV